MAKIEIINEESGDIPASTETIEVRVWGLGGTREQLFYIGSGVNFHANANFWLEIIYTVEGAPILYTRNFLHQFFHQEGDAIIPLESRLDTLEQQKKGTFGFGDIMPETGLLLTADGLSCSLKITIDTGPVFGQTAPGERSIDIRIDDFTLAEGVRFMRELIDEINAVRQGHHPDPADYADGSSEWPFIQQLNRRAYDRISETYRELYFEYALLTQAFDEWLTQVPQGGSILDAGCGHGQPVINRLLEKGFQVTGSDPSPEMLRRARQQFPDIELIQQTTTALTQRAAFDGVCSFSSMLYLDPIDFLNSIYRLHAALKPGGVLFLYAYDSAPSWRGMPFHHILGQWMWAWHYGMEEAAQLLSEHGYFEVLDAHKVVVDEEEPQRIALELEKQKKEEEEYYQKQVSHPGTVSPPYFKSQIERSPYGYVLTARRRER